MAGLRARGFALLLCVPGAVAGAQQETPSDAPDAELSPADLEAIGSLLRGLAEAMSSGDAEAIGDLLSPALPRGVRKSIVSRARGEFERMSYRKFAFDLKGRLPVDRLGADEVKIVVPAEYEYESLAADMASFGEYSYEFRFAKTPDGWGIAGSDLFEQFTTMGPQQILGWMFLGSLVGALALFFWAWMAFDAWMRTKRGAYGILLILSTPLGAVFYFFAVYLRSRFIPRDDG